MREPLSPLVRQSEMRFSYRVPSAILGVLVLTVGCGSAADETAEPAVPAAEGSEAPETTASPTTSDDTSLDSVATELDPAISATTIAVPPDTGPFEPLTSIPVGELIEPCPDFDSAPGAPQPVDLDRERRLERAVGLLRNYGESFPDEFGTTGVLYDDTLTRRAYATFTDRIDFHRMAIAEIEEETGDTIVCQTLLNASTSALLERTLLAELSGVFVSIGRSRTGIAVELPPGREDIATDLTERYGPAVELKVGRQTFPPTELAEPDASCGPTPAPTPDLGIEFSLTDTAPIAPDDFGQLSLELVITNPTDQRITFDSGTPTGFVLDLAGNVVAEGSTIDIPAVGIPVDLGPGEFIELVLVAGTAACTPGGPSQLLPGDYLVVAEVFWGTAPGEFRNVYSPAFPITIA